MNKDTKILKDFAEFAAGIGAGAMIMAIILYAFSELGVAIILFLVGIAIIIGCLSLDMFMHNLERRRKHGGRKNIRK